MVNKKLKVIAALQARMGSRRLKGKALRKILGRTLIERIFERLKRAKEVDQIILATADTKENDVLAEHAKKIGLKYYRGSEDDLISRFIGACRKFKASALVRITGDCPLVDPTIVDKMVKVYRRNSGKFDFLTNDFPRTFPGGLDVDVLPLSTLERLDKEVKDPHCREYLTPYIMDNPRKFRIYNLKNPRDLSSLRWMVDYQSDLDFVTKVFEAIYKKNKIFTMKDIINFIKKV